MSVKFDRALAFARTALESSGASGQVDPKEVEAVFDAFKETFADGTVTRKEVNEKIVPFLREGQNWPSTTADVAMTIFDEIEQFAHVEPNPRELAEHARGWGVLQQARALWGEGMLSGVRLEDVLASAAPDGRPRPRVEAVLGVARAAGELTVKHVELIAQDAQLDRKSGAEWELVKLVHDQVVQEVELPPEVRGFDIPREARLALDELLAQMKQVLDDDVPSPRAFDAEAARRQGHVVRKVDGYDVVFSRSRAGYGEVVFPVHRGTFSAELRIVDRHHVSIGSRRLGEEQRKELLAAMQSVTAEELKQIGRMHERQADPYQRTPVFEEALQRLTQLPHPY